MQNQTSLKIDTIYSITPVKGAGDRLWLGLGVWQQMLVTPQSAKTYLTKTGTWFTSPKWAPIHCTQGSRVSCETKLAGGWQQARMAHTISLQDLR